MPGLKDFFRSDAFVPTSAVFPAIDAERLASDLSLAKEGAARGARCQPEADETVSTPSRRASSSGSATSAAKGIDSYAENEKVYNARLSRAAEPARRSSSPPPAPAATSRPHVAVWKARMAAPSARSATPSLRSAASARCTA